MTQVVVIFDVEKTDEITKIFVKNVEFSESEKSSATLYLAVCFVNR